MNARQQRGASVGRSGNIARLAKAPVELQKRLLASLRKDFRKKIIRLAVKE